MAQSDKPVEYTMPFINIIFQCKFSVFGLQIH